MRRLYEKDNYLCLCGHSKRRHSGDDYSLWCDGNVFDSCSCDNYRLDNLSFLEAKAHERESNLL